MKSHGRRPNERTLLDLRTEEDAGKPITQVRCMRPMPDGLISVKTINSAQMADCQVTTSRPVFSLLQRRTGQSSGLLFLSLCALGDKDESGRGNLSVICAPLISWSMRSSKSEEPRKASLTLNRRSRETTANRVFKLSGTPAMHAENIFPTPMYSRMSVHKLEGNTRRVSIKEYFLTVARFKRA